MALYPNYRLDIKDTSGVRQYSVNDFDYLFASKEVNKPGKLIALFDGSEVFAESLAHKSQIELWRYDPLNPSAGWYRFFSGLYVKQHWTNPDVENYELTAAGDLWLLSTRVVAWPADTNLRSRFVNYEAESVAKTIVNFNCAGNATAAGGRLRDGVITGLSIQGTTTTSNLIDWNCFADNVLESIQKICQIGGGDVDLVKTGATTWEFRWYAGQLGTDRTATVKFSLDRGNMGDPVYTYDRIDEKTVCIAGGKGEGADREFVIATGPDYVAGSNDYEVFYNGSGKNSTDELTDAANQRIRALKAEKVFDFDVLQNNSTVLDRDYFLGDLVNVINPFTAESLTRKVQYEAITLQAGQDDSIDVTLVTP